MNWPENWQASIFRLWQLKKYIPASPPLYLTLPLHYLTPALKLLDSASLLPDSVSTLPDSASHLHDSPSHLPDSTSLLTDSTSLLPDSVSLLPDSVSALLDSASTVKWAPADRLRYVNTIQVCMNTCWMASRNSISPIAIQIIWECWQLILEPISIWSEQKWNASQGCNQHMPTD